MSLADFLPTPESRSAWLAVGELAERLADARPTDASPLVLHGPPGTGKTHLVRGLVEAATATGRTAELVAAADLARLPEPAAGAASFDLWVVEDLQHLAPRAALLLEKVLESRLQRSRATVVTSVVAPSRLTLPPRLASRITGGLVLALEPPSVVSRRKLLDHLAPPGLRVKADALDWLAERLSGVRLLVGAVQTLEALAKDSPVPLDRAAVIKHWSAEPTTASPTPERVLERVAEYFGTDARALRGKQRQSALAWPAQLAMALTRELAGRSATELGAFFGGREPSTIRHACRTVARRVASDPAAAADWRRLVAELGTLIR